MTDIVLDKDLKDFITLPDFGEEVEKGGPTSGNYGHSGRPGKVGGSAPSKDAFGPGSEYYRVTHTDNDYGPFGGDEARYRNTYYSVFGKTIDEPLSLINMSVSYDRFVRGLKSESERAYKPDQDGYIYVGEDPYIRSLDFGVRYGTPEWDKLWRDKETSLRYITPEQFQYVMDKFAEKAAERREFLDMSLNMPESYDNIIPGMDITSSHAYDAKFGSEQYKLFEKASQNINQSLLDADITAYSKEELNYTIFDKYDQQLSDKYGENSEEAKNGRSWLYRLGDEATNIHEFEVLKSISIGDMYPEKGAELGVNTAIHPWGDTTWQPLPNELYHASTDSDSIEANGIKSRRELGGRVSEVGLGGGEDNTISFGTDGKLVGDIERSLHEAHMVATGKLTVRKMLEVARDGAGGVGKNWAADLVRMKDQNFFKNHPEIDERTYDPFKDGMPDNLQRLLDEEDGKRKPYTYEWDTPEATGDTIKDKILDHAFEYYKYDFSSMRQYNGGFMDPVFFGTNWKQLSKKDPKKFKTLKYKPSNHRSRGYQMSSLTEWRIVGGDAVELVEVTDNYDADDEGRILGYTQ